MIEQVKDNFTQIPNQIIDDIRISDRAKAVYVKMRRCGPNGVSCIKFTAYRSSKCRYTASELKRRYRIL